MSIYFCQHTLIFFYLFLYYISINALGTLRESPNCMGLNHNYSELRDRYIN